jgi:hypothetical protein
MITRCDTETFQVFKVRDECMGSITTWIMENNMFQKLHGTMIL